MRRLQPHRCARLSSRAGAVILARTDELGELGFSLFVERDGAAVAAQALVAAGGVEIDHETRDVVRVESGRPAFPDDMDQGDDPARGGYRGSGDQRFEGLLRWAGGHHPDPPPGAGPHRTEARRV